MKDSATVYPVSLFAGTMAGAVSGAGYWYVYDPSMTLTEAREAGDSVVVHLLGDVVYIPVGQDTLEQLLPELRHDDVWLATHEYNYPLPESSRLTSADRDTEVYAYANLHNWRDTTEYEILSEHRKGLQEGMLGVIDGFAELHDAGVTVPSQRESVEGETYTTMLEVLQE